MIRLSAFADEIADDPREQLNVLETEGIRTVDLRSAWGINVLELSDGQVADLRRLFVDRAIRVNAIASPIGKTPIDAPFDLEQRRMTRAIELAHQLDSRAVRIFSFYPPEGRRSSAPDEYREEVLRRISALSVQAEREGIVLLHENEKDIYGDTVARCVDLHQNLPGSHFRAVFDPANFIQCGERPYPDGYNALHPWLAAVHVKDATLGGLVTPAGQGAAGFPALLAQLKADGFDGVLSLEPHLGQTDKYGGWSGAELFHTACQAFRDLLRDLDWQYS